MRVIFVGTGDPHLDRYPPGGGIENQVWLLAHELARRNHDVKILSRDEGKLVREGLEVIHVPVGGRGQVLAKLPMGWRMRQMIRRLRPDVIYLSEKWASFFPSHSDVPRIYATHNKDAFETYRAQAYEDNALNRVFFGVKRRIEEGEMRRSEVVGANSRGVLEYVRSRGMLHAEPLPMAVDVAGVETSSERAPPYVLASGQLLRVKGTHDLVEAFAKLAGGRPDWTLAIGGRGPERVALERQVRDAGIASRVRFLGWQPKEEFARTLAGCAFFALPSYAETFGTVLLEAMAYGKPVLATDITGPRDVVVAGETGMLVPPGDIEMLVDALARLMDDADMRAAMGRAGAQRVRKTFTVAEAADAFERAAALAIERHRRRGKA